MEIKELFEAARKARASSYAPYSDFKVGAALLCANGRVYTGCNIENSAFSPTVCAERVAFFKAVEAGEREFEAIAVCGGADAEAYCPPCGVCRQVMAEFCGEDFKTAFSDGNGGFETHTLKELLPFGFGGKTEVKK